MQRTRTRTEEVCEAPIVALASDERVSSDQAGGGVGAKAPKRESSEVVEAEEGSDSEGVVAEVGGMGDDVDVAVGIEGGAGTSKYANKACLIWPCSCALYE